MKKIALGIILVLISVLQNHAQELPDSIINDFFKTYEKEGASKALDDLYATNPWTSRIQDAINNIKNQMERFDEELVGEYYGYEKIVSKKLGDSYVLESYFLKFDRQFLRLTFQFYRPKDKWRLLSFKFDDTFDDEIEEAAKLYYLNLDN
ncbi:hypothetical protein D1614_12680 [Maribellus luteus]|uniref:DUF3887 domain-containing protein n=2 Tax=Maribellus luteus TaxID=2305463 RepID=A0A399T197_9BACT|nr:hypothetical protein D1614_12680 [Maribellus luteus]